MSRGTEGSNPASSSGESANFRSLEMTAGGSMEWQALQNSGPLGGQFFMSPDRAHEAVGRARDRKFADSPLEETVSSELAQTRPLNAVACASAQSRDVLS